MDARSCRVGGRPLCQRLQRRGFNGDGRSDRVSLPIVTRHIATRFIGSLELRGGGARLGYVTYFYYL